MKYIDAEELKAKLRRQKREIDDIEYIFSIIDSLQQEPIEKDEDAEKLILRDIMEATVARINEGKVDKEKEENIMMEKITYLRNLGLKGE